MVNGHSFILIRQTAVLVRRALVEVCNVPKIQDVPEPLPLLYFWVTVYNKSSAIAEMGDRGHNRHGPKRGGVLCPFRGALGTRLIQCGLRRCLRPYQVASSSIQPFGHNSVGCHSPHRNISTN